ncbi:hypothetical protein [Cyanobium gracile]|uniref:hypothetical protein n=1 Tax=Cyanobium gracile TaxID=59930 RepID=UPI0012EAE986|nr:hypothetical protein [Cyanobium gracile]
MGLMLRTFSSSEAMGADVEHRQTMGNDLMSVVAEVAKSSAVMIYRGRNMILWLADDVFVDGQFWQLSPDERRATIAPRLCACTEWSGWVLEGEVGFPDAQDR